VLSAFKTAGFKGVMLDTMNKQKGSLTQVMSKLAIAEFVKQAKALELLCGLAGSLRLSDIPELLLYAPDYLGFRGALCEEHVRVGQLNKQAVLNIKQAMNMTVIKA